MIHSAKIYEFKLNFIFLPSTCDFKSYQKTVSGFFSSYSCYGPGSVGWKWQTDDEIVALMSLVFKELS